MVSLAVWFSFTVMDVTNWNFIHVGSLSYKNFHLMDYVRCLSLFGNV